MVVVGPRDEALLDRASKTFTPAQALSLSTTQSPSQPPPGAGLGVGLNRCGEAGSGVDGRLEEMILTVGHQVHSIHEPVLISFEEIDFAMPGVRT